MKHRREVYNPSPSSRAFRGIEFIRSAGRPVAATELAVLSGCIAKDVSGVFALAIKKGRLVQELIGNRVCYSIGDDIPLPARQVTDAPIDARLEAPSRPPRVASVFELGTIAKIEAEAEAEAAR